MKWKSLRTLLKINIRSYPYLCTYKTTKPSFRRLFKTKTMKPIEIQNEINLVNARIQQLENSELYSEIEKLHNIEKLQIQLQNLHQEAAKNIEVINPEVL